MVWQALASGVVAEELWADLRGRYQADGRFYHNLSHIQHMLSVLAPVKALISDWTAVQWAVWFHDVIYDPRASDNEAQSAAFARQQLVLLGVGEGTITAVEALILATRLGETGASHADAAWIQDADLAVLGADRAVYAAYAAAIRQEYGHVPQAAFAHGRGQVLAHFLARPRLYQTDYFFARFEAQARANLDWELKQHS